METALQIEWKEKEKIIFFFIYNFWNEFCSVEELKGTFRVDRVGECRTERDKRIFIIQCIRHMILVTGRYNDSKKVTRWIVQNSKQSESSVNYSNNKYRTVLEKWKKRNRKKPSLFTIVPLSIRTSWMLLCTFFPLKSLESLFCFPFCIYSVLLFVEHLPLCEVLFTYAHPGTNVSKASHQLLTCLFSFQYHTMADVRLCIFCFLFLFLFYLSV